MPFHRPTKKGSSPRVRGAAELIGAGVEDEGIIPARAGSSHRRSRRRVPGRDHPRACGEQGYPYDRSSISQGSSPRVRGAVLLGVHGTWADGIIPARAGSRSLPMIVQPTQRDHPRACGEQIVYELMRSGVGGSSPRVRGAVEASGLPEQLYGIIPARAGSR